MCDELRVDASTGLSEAEAGLRLGAAGPNRIQTEPAPSRLALVARQFANSMVLLLLGAAVISLAIGELLDATVILAIVAANALFGAVQEGRADEAAAAVRALLAPTARLVRDGHVRERPAEVVVPGDVVVLGAGDRVPADGRLVEARCCSSTSRRSPASRWRGASAPVRPILPMRRSPNGARPCSPARPSPAGPAAWS